jgi:hypothetical protein
MDKEFLILETTFQELEIRIGKLDENAARDRKYDLSVMTHGELKKILESKIGSREKHRILLTQIGFLRINIFNDCYQKIQFAETKKDFDEAVEIMNDYIETVAVRFMKDRLHPSLTDRIIKAFSKSKIPDAAKTIEEWKNSLSTWVENKSALLDQEKRIEEFTKMKNLFITLDMLSFSLENFPPLATESTH